MRVASAGATLAFRSLPSDGKFKVILVVKCTSPRSADWAGIRGIALMGEYRSVDARGYLRV